MSQPSLPPLPPCCTQPSQGTQLASGCDEEPEDNCVVACGGKFIQRLKFWSETCKDLHQMQIAAVFCAGATINNNFLTKEKELLLEMATKHKSVAEEMVSANIISLNDAEKSFKKLKHLTKEKPKTTVQIAGWPSGKSLWDRCNKCRRTARNAIGPLTPVKAIDPKPSH